MRAWNAVPVPAPDPVVPGVLRLYDTAHRAVVPVGPAAGEARPATMYVCGITPYDATHLGHAFTYLTFDLVNRVWRDLGHDVAYTQNVTDVDDPLLERAQVRGVDWRDLAADELAVFRSDMEALRILPPGDFVAVTDAIGLVADYLTGLRARDEVYALDDAYADWYFRIARPGFGDESHLGPAEMLALFAERGGDPDRPGKADPLDPLVWRLHRPGEPAWDSALDRGRPGWHVQCTAIAAATLGPAIDVQGGGSDLVFPHHEMCNTLAATATGAPLARAFVHSAMVGLDGEKMSKSRGNLVKVAGLVAAGADPMAIRLALLAHHYAADWSWSDGELAGAAGRLELWRRAVRGASSVGFSATATAVRAELRENLHADRALDRLDDWARASLAAAADHPGARAAMAALTDALLGVALT